MHSIRTKITTLIVCAIIIAMTVSTILSVAAIKNLGTNNANHILSLLCDTGEKNLDASFDNVEQAVKSVSDYAQNDLSHTELSELEAHVDHVRAAFEKTANNTSGILTYYYRIDPDISSASKGFWYVDLTGDGFVEHEVTDITKYDTEDQSNLVWFTVPKATGEPVWLPPYITDNLNVCVLSYNVPIYKDDLFVGVIGIEVDYNSLVEQVNNILLYSNGYAFINDSEGNIIYHPHMKIEDLLKGKAPQVPDGLLSDSHFIRYKFNGVEKQAVWKELDNGMRLNVTVPISEININWQKLINAIVIVSAILLIIFILLSLRFAGRITRPLKKLTDAAKEVDAGNFDIDVDHAGNDEVGILTNTFKQVVDHLKVYISDLNSLAYADALTAVRNKGAFDIYKKDIQTQIIAPDKHPEFAVGIFDCNDLKHINDKYGHDKGDIYIRTACDLICHVFMHSPVFRIGGDEFAVVLQNEDYKNRDDLILLFEEKSANSFEASNEAWEQVNIAMGIAIYDPKTDRTINDVIRRADRLMYKNKRNKKNR